MEVVNLYAGLLVFRGLCRYTASAATDYMSMYSVHTCISELLISFGAWAKLAQSVHH